MLEKTNVDISIKINHGNRSNAQTQEISLCLCCISFSHDASERKHKRKHRHPKLSVSMAHKKTRSCMGIPMTERLKKIIIWKDSQLKSLTLLQLSVASFPCGYFPDPTRFEPFLNFSVVNCIIKSQDWRLNSQEPPICSLQCRRILGASAHFRIRPPS